MALNPTKPQATSFLSKQDRVNRTTGPLTLVQRKSVLFRGKRANAMFKIKRWVQNVKKKATMMGNSKDCSLYRNPPSRRSRTIKNSIVWSDSTGCHVLAIPIGIAILLLSHETGETTISEEQFHGLIHEGCVPLVKCPLFQSA